MTNPHHYLAAQPIIEAHQWHRHGDHPRDDLQNGILFVQRYEGTIVELVNFRPEGGYSIADSHTSATALSCVVPMEEHGFILLPETADAAEVRGTLVVVCPGDYVARNVTDPEFVDTYRSFSADIFDRMFVPLQAKVCDHVRFRYLILDLDRCQHGRHAADPCFGCPGGRSSGNQLIPPGTLIGTSLHGRIVVPPHEQRDDPHAWQVPDAEMWDKLATSAAHSQSLMRIGAASINWHVKMGNDEARAELNKAFEEHFLQFPGRP